MSEAKFTKVMEAGITTDNAPFCVDGFCNNDGQRFEVCSIWGSDDDTEPCEQSKANAHLMAAASEMYEILSAISDCIELGQTDALNAFDIEQLLAKARGEHV